MNIPVSHDSRRPEYKFSSGQKQAWRSLMAAITTPASADGSGTGPDEDDTILIHFSIYVISKYPSVGVWEE